MELTGRSHLEDTFLLAHPVHQRLKTKTGEFSLPSGCAVNVDLDPTRFYTHAAPEDESLEFLRGDLVEWRMEKNIVKYVEFGRSSGQYKLKSMENSNGNAYNSNPSIVG